jgi:hypothetical protein
LMPRAGSERGERPAKAGMSGVRGTAGVKKDVVEGNGLKGRVRPHQMKMAVPPLERLAPPTKLLD